MFNKNLSFFFLLLIGFVFLGCSVKPPSVSFTQSGEIELKDANPLIKNKVDRLGSMVLGLSSEVDEDEAYTSASIAILYPYHLGQEYGLVAPAHFHNFLITMGIKDRGLCYHWAADMMEQFKAEGFTSVEFYRIVSEHGSLGEHHAILITAKGKALTEGIVLDAWRNSSELYFSKIQEDQAYEWEQNRRYDVIWAKSPKKE